VVRLAAALVGVVTVLASACGGSGYHYVASKGSKLTYRKTVGKSYALVDVKSAPSFFKVPGQWKVYQQDDMLKVSGEARTMSPSELFFLRAKRRMVGFDASDPPSALHPTVPLTDRPAGFEQVSVLNDDERDTVSLETLRNFVFPIDKSITAAQQSGSDPRVEVIARDDEVTQAGGLHGTHLVFNVKTKDQGVTLTFDQTTLLDKTSRVLYVFVVGCDSVCFLRDQSTIKNVVHSWTIKESS
jgi:hypothetical protein